MTTVSKCLVVFAVAVSLAFLGFASAVLQGGPNYQSQLKDPMLNGYVFETTTVKKSTGDLKAGTKLYTVKTRRPKQDAEGTWAEEVLEKDSPVLSKVIIAARNHLKSQQEAELQRIREGDKDGDGPEVLGIEELKVEIQRAITEINEDIAAFKKRESAPLLHAENGAVIGIGLVVELQKIQKAINDVTETAQNETAKAAQLQITATRRREDVLRLKNQLEEIETDIFRSEKQREKLEDLLIRVQSKVQRLKRRNKQLKY